MAWLLDHHQGIYGFVNHCLHYRATEISYWGSFRRSILTHSPRPTHAFSNRLDNFRTPVVSISLTDNTSDVSQVVENVMSRNHLCSVERRENLLKIFHFRCFFFKKPSRLNNEHRRKTNLRTRSTTLKALKIVCRSPMICLVCLVLVSIGRRRRCIGRYQEEMERKFNQQNPDTLIAHLLDFQWASSRACCRYF